MQNRPIDDVLYSLERIADKRGKRLEDVDGYVGLCEFLTDLDVWGFSDSYYDKQHCKEVLCKCVAHVLPELNDPWAYVMAMIQGFSYNREWSDRCEGKK